MDTKTKTTKAQLVSIVAAAVRGCADIIGPCLVRPENQFSLTRAALSTGGRARSKFLSVRPLITQTRPGVHHDA